jgi:RND superfamily putative drug exporter
MSHYDGSIHIQHDRLTEIGVGLTLAVLVHATLVRTLLVQALMHVLGRANWWAPKPLARLHDRLGISEAATPQRSEAA